MRTTDGTSPSVPATEPRADESAGAAAAAAPALVGEPLTKSVKFMAVTPVPSASVPPRACRLFTAERGGVATTPVRESEYASSTLGVASPRAICACRTPDTASATFHLHTAAAADATAATAGETPPPAAETAPTAAPMPEGKLVDACDPVSAALAREAAADKPDSAPNLEEARLAVAAVRADTSAVLVRATADGSVCERSAIVPLRTPTTCPACSMGTANGTAGAVSAQGMPSAGRKARAKESGVLSTMPRTDATRACADHGSIAASPLPMPPVFSDARAARALEGVAETADLRDVADPDS